MIPVDVAVTTAELLAPPSVLLLLPYLEPSSVRSDRPRTQARFDPLLAPSVCGTPYPNAQRYVQTEPPLFSVAVEDLVLLTVGCADLAPLPCEQRCVPCDLDTRTL